MFIDWCASNLGETTLIGIIDNQTIITTDATYTYTATANCIVGTTLPVNDKGTITVEANGTKITNSYKSNNGTVCYLKQGDTLKITNNTSGWNGVTIAIKEM